MLLYTYSHSAVRLHSTAMRDAAVMQVELSAFFLQQRVGLHWNTQPHASTLTHIKPLHRPELLFSSFLCVNMGYT